MTPDIEKEPWTATATVVDHVVRGSLARHLARGRGGPLGTTGTVSPVILRGPRVTLRPATADDVERLRSIRDEPEVSRWWGTLEPGELEGFVAEDTTFAIETGGEVIGAIQYAEERDPMYRHAAIDIYLTARSHRRGLGSEAVRVLARFLIEERGHHRLTIDPATDNVAAIRAYEKVGFRPVGVMRSSERGPDGTWHDGLLMDLLADELTDGAPESGSAPGP